jgi:hypothetical protein
VVECVKWKLQIVLSKSVPLHVMEAFEGE